jgi:hypothetical protein
VLLRCISRARSELLVILLEAAEFNLAWKQTRSESAGSAFD